MNYGNLKIYGNFLVKNAFSWIKNNLEYVIHEVPLIDCISIHDICIISESNWDVLVQFWNLDFHVVIKRYNYDLYKLIWLGIRRIFHLWFNSRRDGNTMLQIDNWLNWVTILGIVNLPGKLFKNGWERP